MEREKQIKNFLEMVDHPEHYNHGLKDVADGKFDVECINAMVAAKGIEKVMAYCECCSFKYEWRLGHKDDEEQEIGKIIWYLNKFKELKNVKL